MLLCVSQTPNEVPFTFRATGIRVFTFEEALYHVYHYWKQSADDFLSDGFLAWVSETLGLSVLAARLSRIADEDAFHTRVLAFLKLVPYFDGAELEALSADLRRWEKRREWERLKERADFLCGRGESDKAAGLYRRALALEENAALYNNLAVACMRAEDYAAASRHLRRALDICADSERLPLLLHAAEAAVYGGAYGGAAAMIDQAEALSPGERDIPFLRGLLFFHSGDYAAAVRHLEAAIAEAPEPFYLYRLADVYAKMRQYDKALAALERVGTKDAAFYERLAALHAASGNMAAACRAVQSALLQQNQNAALWTKLAAYHRQDYDLPRAAAAVAKALSLAPEDARAQLESARVKKGMGRQKEYQALLNNVLSGFRYRYREAVE